MPSRTSPLTIAGWCVLALVALAALRSVPLVVWTDRAGLQIAAEGFLKLAALPAAVAVVVDGGAGRWRPRFVGAVTAGVLAVLAIVTYVVALTRPPGEYGDEPLGSQLILAGGSLILTACVTLVVVLARNRRRAVVAGAATSRARGALRGLGIGAAAGAVATTALVVTTWGGPSAADEAAVVGVFAGAAVGALAGMALEERPVPGRAPRVALVLWWVDLVLLALFSVVLAALPVGLQFFGERADRNDYLDSAMAAAAAGVPLAAALVLALLLRSRVGATVAGVLVVGFGLLALSYRASVAGAPADRFADGPDGDMAWAVILNPAALACYVGLIVALVSRARINRARRGCSTSPHRHP